MLMAIIFLVYYVEKHHVKCNLRYLTYDDSEMMEVNVLNIYGKTAS